MSVVDSLEAMASWLRDHACEGIELKPMDPDAPEDEAFDYRLVRPEVHTLMVPTHKHKPPGMIATVPAIVIQLLGCKDDGRAQLREMELRLSFTAFDPGIHSEDKIIPIDGEASDSGFGPVYRLDDGRTFSVNYDGWRDAFNFMDHAVRVIENAGAIGDFPLKPGAEIKLGNYEFQDSADELYPFWLCWCSLTVLEPIVRNHEVPGTRNQQIEELL